MLLMLLITAAAVDVVWGQDDCGSRAIVTGLPYVSTGSISEAAHNFGGESPCPLGGPDVIYEFTPLVSGAYSVSLCGSQFDTFLYVRSGGLCPGSVQIACNDNGCHAPADTLTLPQSYLDLPLAADSTYFVIVSRADTSTNGDYVLSISLQNQGDNCASAIAIDSLPYRASWTTIGALDDYHCGGNTAPDVIYSFTPDQSGIYAVTSCGSAGAVRLETRVGGSCPGNSQLSCADIGCTLNGDTIPTYYVQLDLTAGLDYYVIVDGADGQSEGNFSIGVVPLGAEDHIVCPPGESFFESSSFPAEWASYISNDAGATWSQGYHPARHAIMTYPTYDPILGGTVLPCTREGTYGIRLGNDYTNNEADGLSTYFTVSAADPILRFSYALVLQDPGHSASSQPTFSYTVYTMGMPWPVTITSIVKGADANDPYFILAASTQGGTVVYHPWECVAVDLSAYVGQTVFVDFRTADCSLGGHYGYAYIDGFCDSGYQPVLTMADTVCDDDPEFWADGSATTGEISHFWSVEQSDEFGNRYPLTERSQWFVGQQAGVKDLKSFYLGLGGTYICNTWYRATLALWDGGCFGWRSTEKLFFVACCGPGCCCYCDSLNHTFQAITTFALCNQLAGLWTPNSTCGSPCVFPEHVKVNSIQAPEFSCVNGVFSPTIFDLTVQVHNSAPYYCDVSGVQLSGGSGPGGVVIPLTPLSTSFLLAPGGTQVVTLPVQLTSIFPSGGCVNVTISITSSCCEADSDYCINIPPCPCPFQDYETQHNVESFNNSCETIEASIGCGTYCGTIVSAIDVDFYRISTLNPFPGHCVELDVNVYGNDTPTEYPYGKGLNPRVSIYHSMPGGMFGLTCASLLATDDSLGVGNDCQIAPCVNPLPEYFIKVEGEGGSSGPYVLDIQCHSCDCSPACEDSCDNWLTDLQNWWPLDELAGTTSADVASNRDGTWQGTPTPIPAVVGPRGLLFNGSNDVRSPDHPYNNVNDGSFTLDCWFEQSNLSPGAESIAGKEDDQGGFQLYVEDSQLCCRVNDAVGNPVAVKCGPNISSGVWYFAAMTFEKFNSGIGTGILRLYVNGVQWGGIVVTTQGSLASAGTYFGIASTQVTGFGKFNGAIDEVELFRRALRADELLKIYNSGSVGKCKEYCHITGPFNWNGSVAQYTLTLCNSGPQANYSFLLGGVTPTTPGCAYMPPTVLSPSGWQGSYPLPSGGNNCQTFTINVTLPAGIPLFECACFQVEVLNETTGDIFCCEHQLCNSPFEGDTGGDSSLTGRIGVPVGNDSTYSLRIKKDLDMLWSGYGRLREQAPDASTPRVRISGASPGVAFPFTIPDLALGDSVVIPFTLEFTSRQAVAVHDLVIEVDRGDGEWVPLHNYWLQSLDDSPPPTDVTNLVIKKILEAIKKLYWPPVAGAASYAVYSSPDVTVDPLLWTLEGMTSDTTFTDSTDGLRKFYFVRSVN
ncbi:LamG domain-containing protein [candidate division KSB1 bacterium]|nr:LamG domain-containing protein [candidate division KSB1 bacterium]